MIPSVFGTNSFIDNFFDDPWFRTEGARRPERGYGREGANIMRTDVKETENDYEVMMDLPGFKKEDVNAELKNGYLTIKASKSEEADNSSDKYIRKERYSGSFARSFYVGENMRKEDIKASFENGVLKLVMPKTAPQQVEQDNFISIEG